MNPTILAKYNQYLRRQRPLLDQSIICDVFRNNTFLEIAFISKCCRNDAKGSCVMCDYGAISGTKTQNIYLSEMERILNQNKGIKYLLLCANGSIMDEHQLSERTFKSILHKAGTSEIPNIIIETHYQDITSEKLSYIAKYLKHQNITIEIGVETVNQEYQDLVIMKGIKVEELKEKITLIQSAGISVDINIMLGLPFLSPLEQLRDTLSSVSWGFNHGCNPVIFPLNIKPYTLLMHMYKAGFYQPISHWLILILLNQIEETLLDRITISYYGNRKDEYKNVVEETIYPVSCIKCHDILMDFYEEFFRLDDWKSRKSLLNRILKWEKCDCYKKQQLDLLEEKEQINFKDKMNDYISYLKKDIILT